LTDFDKEDMKPKPRDIFWLPLELLLLLDLLLTLKLI
jgi:hypothetical protein